MKRLVPVLTVLALLVVSVHAHAATKPAEGHKVASAQPARAEGAAAVDSLGLLEKAVAKDSSNFDNLYRLGVLYMDRDRISEASRVLMKAHQLRPRDVRTLVNVGVAFDAAGQPDFAQKYYDNALQLAPEDTVAMCRKASSIYGQGHYDEAMKVLREIVAKRPNAYCAYFTLGVAFADAGLYRDAIRMWRRVVDLAPASPEAVSARESIEVLEKFLAQPQGQGQ